MRIHLGGHLSWYDPQKRTDLDIPLSSPTDLAAVVRQIGLPVDEISVIAVNGASTGLDVQVSDSDSVELFPPIGGGGTDESH